MANAVFSQGRGQGQESTPHASSETVVEVETEGRTAQHIFNEQTNYVPKSTIITIFLACSAVDLVALMDQTTLAASLSIIGNALDASDQTSWISGAYFVTSTCFQLLYGRLSDIWSRKYILYTGLVIFFTGSLAASLAQTATQLIIFRAFTGVGGGGLMTVAQMIVSDVVPLRERGKYQGILGAVVALANGIGPVIGGALASIDADSWRWIFRLNLPLTALTTLCVWLFMPLRKVSGDWRAKLRAIDFVGAGLALGGTAVLLLGLNWGGGEYPWREPHVVATLAVGATVCVLFVLWQWKGTSCPLVPMHIFTSRIVNGACLTIFVNGWNFLVQIYYIPTFYQLVFGYSTVKAGAMLLPITLMQTFSSTVSGLVVHWLGRYRECILFGWMIWAVGLGLFSTLDKSSGLGKQIGYGILTGVGVGNTLQPSLIAIQAGVERRDMAVVTSFRNFVRNLGGTLGLAISGTIINNLLSSSISGLGLDASDKRAFLSSPQNYLSGLPAEEAENVRAVLIPAYRRGFRIIFVVEAALAAFAFCLAFVLMPQVSLKREDDEKLKEEGKKRVQGETDDEKGA
ncbi:putative MFS drug transporter [Aspergillus clavatus NRRL 1]|uniref:MFS drug transporter, putative n=1 Tax=Aspergillus clavatus (strain ATCC 1007 / CBS 513.65 / DSM 816 / NCTC 3887 / NRRL 1 / QM 1276 / 107) TaxID=344612 RepID=A1C981_ASPCL|nr:MFS drug transporter, putative [Aspergillus clavatus NRRL 1]EAW13405.1 MFS drug transporter, putative [Aspergillus clavatus NRRL 1]